MTMPELVDAYNAGVVTQDTFIWTDGMDDWRPLAEVEPVVSALHASAGQMAVGTPGAFETPGIDAAAAVAAAPMAAGYGGGDPYAGGGADYGAAAAAAAAPAAEPRRAAVAKRGETRGRDLFATNVGDEIQTSAPAVPEGMAAAPAAGGGLTGQRNENSVLFSLAVLTKNADERAPQHETTANKEDSGLIDLKALAAKAESVRPPAGAADHDVFTAPIGGLGAPLGAPMGALSPLGTPDGPQKSKLPLYIGAGGGMLVLLVLGIVIGVKLAGPAPVPAMSAMATVAPPPSATVDPSAAASASAAPEASASAAPSASVAAKPKWGGGGGGYHPPAHPGGGSGGVGGSGGAAPTPPPTPAPKKGGGDCGCNGDLMCLMKCSTH